MRISKREKTLSKFLQASPVPAPLLRTRSCLLIWLPRSGLNSCRPKLCARILQNRSRCRTSKALAFERIRWRNLGVTNKDPLVENILVKLKAAARNLGTPLSERVWDRLAIDHSLTAEKVCSDLLKDMHQKALAVTNWRKDDAVLLSKATFFERLPSIAKLKFAGRLQSLQGKYEAIKGLINKHSGEVVEASVGITLGGWVLKDSIQSLTDADLSCPPQFHSKRRRQNFL